MLGIDEELLRDEGRKARQSRRPTASARPFKPQVRTIDAGTQAKLGLCALALLWPDLRAAIGSRINSPNADKAIHALAEACRTNLSDVAIEAVVMEHLSDDERVRLSELMVGPLLADERKKTALMEDYLKALVEKDRRDQLRDLRRTAAGSTEDPTEATAAAQEVITLRRQSGHREY
jgi:hypothetical protein